MKKILTILLVAIAAPAALIFALSVLVSKKENHILSSFNLFNVAYADFPETGALGGGAESAGNGEGISSGGGGDAGGNAAAQGNDNGGSK